MARGRNVIRLKRGSNPHIRVHPNGHVTIAGLSLSMAQNLLTIARLYRYEHKHEAGCGCEGCRNFTRENIWIIETLENQLTAAVKATHGNAKEASLKERLAKNEKTRRLIKSLLAPAGTAGQESV